MPEISEGYAASIMSGIEDHLLREGYFYFVASHRGQPDLIEEYPRMLIDRAVEGVILLNTPVREVLSVPAVSISGHQKVQGVTNIAVDHKLATFAALEHLVKLGHREIAFFKGHKGSADTEYRWRGIVHAASLLGIEVRPGLTVQLQKGVAHPAPSLPEEGYSMRNNYWPQDGTLPHCLPSMTFPRLAPCEPSRMPDSACPKIFRSSASMTSRRLPTYAPSHHRKAAASPNGGTGRKATAGKDLRRQWARSAENIPEAGVGGTGVHGARVRKTELGLKAGRVSTLVLRRFFHEPAPIVS